MGIQIYETISSRVHARSFEEKKELKSSRWEYGLNYWSGRLTVTFTDSVDLPRTLNGSCFLTKSTLHTHISWSKLPAFWYSLDNNGLFSSENLNSRVGEVMSPFIQIGLPSDWVLPARIRTKDRVHRRFVSSFFPSFFSHRWNVDSNLTRVRCRFPTGIF
jgi:hypothetical protein